MAASAKAEAVRDRQLLVRLLAPVGAEAASGIADRLIDRFGSLHAVLAADALTCSIFLKDSPAAAEQVEIVQAALRHATATRVSQRPLFPSTLAVADYLMVRLADELAEQVRALYLDGAHRLIRDECATRGSVLQAPIFPREIVRRALELGASSLILAHNHPSGNLTPSQSDLASTRRLIAAGSAVDVDILDHLIVSRSGCRSLRADGLI